MSENINMVDALHKTIYNQNQQIAELKKQLNGKKLLEDNYARLSERYDMLDSRHDALLEENSEYEEKIDNLQKQLEKKEQPLECFRDIVEKASKEIKDNYNQYNQLVKEHNHLVTDYNKLIEKLKSQSADIVNNIKKGIKDKIICFFSNEDRKDFNKILKTILKKYQK